MNYRHFVITRFNLRSGDGSLTKDRLGNSVLTDEWLNHRIDIFVKYCFPSMLNPSNRNLLWLLYFDVTTSDPVKNKFYDLETSYSDLIKVIRADGYDDFLARYCTDIRSLCSAEQKYVITTRLDNDDLVHKDFIGKIQENFSGQDFMAINFVKILMINPDKKNKVFIDYSFSNHFISVIENAESSEIHGCYSRGDTAWNNKNEIVHIFDKPYCIELISERNLLNSFRGFPVFKNIDFTAFSLGRQHFSNSLSDPDNFKFYKMSWRKLLLSQKMSLIQHLRKKDQTIDPSSS